MQAKLLLACLLGFLPGLCSCTSNHTGYIKPAALVEGYHGTTAKRQAFIAQSKVWQSNLDSLTSELDTKSARRKASEEQILQYRQAVQQKAQAEEARMNQDILTDINSYIKQYGKDKDYEFILGATDNGNIVYAAEGKDITEEVLAGLNKQYDQQHSAKR